MLPPSLGLKWYKPRNIKWDLTGLYNGFSSGEVLLKTTAAVIRVMCHSIQKRDF